MINKRLFSAAFFLSGCLLFAQQNLNTTTPQIIEGVAAIVGDNLILKSDVAQIASMTAMQQHLDPNKDPEKFVQLQKTILQSLIDQKIMLEMAKLDSIEVEDNEVESALDQQEQNIISQAGSEATAVKMLGQSLKSFRREYWQDMKDRLITDKYQQQLLQNIKVTREEVVDFFNTYKDSIPPFPTEIKLRHILIPINPSPESEEQAKHFLDSLKTAIQMGATFEDMAKKYSQDPGTKDRGGDLGYVRRGSLVPEFEAVAFTLESGEISDPVKTDFGYHLIQNIDVKGDRVHVRHILIQPQLTDEDDSRAYKFAKTLQDSIHTLDEYKDFAARYSADDQTKSIGGDLGWVDPNNFSIPELAQVVPYLEKGKCSPPVKTDFGYHLLWLEDIRPGGKPDLKLHWSKIEEMALNHKKMVWYQSWIKDARIKFSIVEKTD